MVIDYYDHWVGVASKTHTCFSAYLSIKEPFLFLSSKASLPFSASLFHWSESPLSLHISLCLHHHLYLSPSVFIMWNIALSIPLSICIGDTLSLSPFCLHLSISAFLNIFLCHYRSSCLFSCDVSPLCISLSAHLTSYFFALFFVSEVVASGGPSSMIACRHSFNDRDGASA